MDTFEIRDNEINVEDIMQKIRDNVKKHRESGVYTSDVETMIDKPLRQPSVNIEKGELQSDINYINSHSDIRAEYNISSHRPILGRLLVFGRKLIHGEVRRYVDIIFSKQIEFNVYMPQIISRLVNKISKNEEDVETIKGSLSKNEEDIETIKETIKGSLSKNEETKLQSNINYFLFNENIAVAWNRLSGDSVQGVPNIFEDAVKIFSGCKNILDIGCGRGTFLKVLKGDINGYGIDINEDFILSCKKEGLKVEKVDAITHLESLEEKTLDGVFAAHVIEHMQLGELEQLIKLCYEKTQFGSHIIFVTPNILNISVSSNYFYMDPTHVNHVHPDVIKFLLESYGFRDVQVRLYQPVPEEMKLKKIDHDRDIDNKVYETMNHNIDVLNNLLFGHRDMAIIAKK